MSGSASSGSCGDGSADDADSADVLDLHLRVVADRLGPAEFEAVVRAASDTCSMPAEGRPAMLAGPGGEGFGSALQREYLALLAVLMTGRTDLEVISVPVAGGARGWAVVEPDVAADPDAVDVIRARIVSREEERVRTVDLLQSWHDSG
ncbi:hypothetical protein AB0P15_29340 [Streptomyces sp. NPDC087917]|uniref:hypothetical protein n=1 Tax=Streptomyces sp. NPDC087917 TaxID=3155060 RepID=UPI00341A91B3